MIKKTWILGVAAALIFTACQKNDKTSTISDGNDEFLSAEYMLADLDDMETPELSGVSESEELQLIGEGRHHSPCHPPKSRDGKPKDCKSKPDELGNVLHRLQLNEEQKNAVRGYMRDHCDCIGYNHEKIRELHKTIIEKANVKRKELLIAYKEGKISELQLRQGLDKIREQVMHSFRENAPKKEHMQELRKCRLQLHQNIASVLNERQLKIWKEWLQQRK